MNEERDNRILCNACLSFSEPDARFCSQCGLPLDADSSRRPSPGTSRGTRSPSAVVARVIGLILILAAAIWGGVTLFEKVKPGLPEEPGGEDAPTATGPAAAPEDDRVDAAGEGARPPTGGAEPPAMALTPDALLSRCRGSIRLFVGLDRKGREVARCAAVETAQGLAIPAAALKGSYLAWAQDAVGGGYEIRSALFFDDFLGSALVRPEEKAGPLAMTDPSDLSLGDRIFRITPGTVEEAAIIVPGLYGGGTYDEATGSARCLFTGSGPGPLGSVLIDSKGRFIGLAPPAGGQEAAVFIPSSFFDAGSRAGSMTLDELNALYYEGSYDALVRDARALLEQSRFEEALGFFERARLEDPVRGRNLEPEILNLSLNIADTLVKRGRNREALELCARKSVEFPFSEELLLLAFRAAANDGEYADAAQWIQKIGALDESLYNDLRGDHIAIYLRWSSELLAKEQRRDAIDVVREGLYYRPDSSTLFKTLGDFLKSARDYRGAAAAFQRAMTLDPNLTAELQPLVTRCAELQEAPGSVALDFDPKGPIRCKGLLDGKVWVDFIVDTGASYTSIPAAAAEKLGYKVDRISRRTRISTAGGERVVPYILMGSIDVSGLVVNQIFVIVNDLSHPEEESGLLGLNFLDKFHITLDPQSGRMVLSNK